MPVRVFIVDDAVVFRKGIGDALSEDPEIQVLGTAANGKIALQKMALNLPDLVILDVEMPEMDGITALGEIRKLWPRLPVIMCSAHTTEGARVTIQALEHGANDFVTKPVTSSAAESIAHFRHELIPRIKGNCRHLLGHPDSGIRPTISALTSKSVSPPLPTKPLNTRPTSSNRIDLVIIGVSTGGPNALADVIPLIPGDFPVPILIVQHMPAMFTKLLAERLASKSALKVAEGSAGTICKAGEIWIAPGGQHMSVSKSGSDIKLELNMDPPENSCRPAVDVLFRAVAQITGHSTLAIILTGMGEDGLIGCRLISQAGGQVIVQDKETSVVWGMPGAVAKAGLAEKQLPLKKIAEEVISRLKVGHPQFHGSVRVI